MPRGARLAGPGLAGALAARARIAPPVGLGSGRPGALHAAAMHIPSGSLQHAHHAPADPPPPLPFAPVQLASVRKARARLGLPGEARGDYALERLVGPEGVTMAELHDFIQQCIRCVQEGGWLGKRVLVGGWGGG